MIRKYNKSVIIMVLVVILFTNIFLMYKNLNNMEVKLDDVRLKKIEKENNSLAIMLEDIEGNYKESDINEFPSNLAYSFNLELSGCIDSNGLIIEDALTYDNVLKNITIKTNKTTYCYIYFDRDKEKPQEFTFYIGGSSNPEYLTSTNTSVYLSWSDNDIKEYCVSESNTSDNCRWNEVSGTSITNNYTLSSGNGTKTLYAYLKDYAGNISSVVSDAITLDTNTYSITYNLNGGTQGSGAIQIHLIFQHLQEMDTTSKVGTKLKILVEAQ